MLTSCGWRWQPPLAVTKTGEKYGPHYYRAYRALEKRPTIRQFTAICEQQGLPAPSRRMFAHMHRLYRSRKRNYMPMNRLDTELRMSAQRWTRKRLETLLMEQGRERSDLEFKSVVESGSALLKTWAAMANSGGGTILYGIEEDASTASALAPIRLLGVEERFRQANEGIDPPIDFDVDIVRLTPGASTGVVAVRVAPAVAGTVHLVNGRAPVRVGSTSGDMTSEQLRRWIQEGRPPG